MADLFIYLFVAKPWYTLLPEKRFYRKFLFPGLSGLKTDVTIYIYVLRILHFDTVDISRNIEQLNYTTDSFKNDVEKCEIYYFFNAKKK